MTRPHDPLAAIAALPFWAGTPAFEELPGGISNVSYVATDAAGRYVVRLTRDFPFHDVYREREVAVAREAHRLGFSPEIVFADQGVMVSRFIEARTLDAASVAADIERIARLIRDFHEHILPNVGEGFDVFRVNRGYVRALAGHIADQRLERWSEINERLAPAASTGPRIFGHHDLLPANLLDDGERLWLIDFEYAQPGDALFDLANLSSNAQLTPEQSRALLAAYHDREPDEELIGRHRAMEAASLLREGLWSLVSGLHIHERPVDYAAYAELNFDRMDNVLAELR